MDVLIVAPQKVAPVILQNIVPMSFAAHTSLHNLEVISDKSVSLVRNGYDKCESLLCIWATDIRLSIQIRLTAVFILTPEQLQQHSGTVT